MTEKKEAVQAELTPVPQDESAPTVRDATSAPLVVTAPEIPVTDAEVYLLFDKRDEQMIADALSGAYVDDFVYTLTKYGKPVMRNGKPVREITYAGILEGARLYQGIHVPVELAQITETDDEFRAIVQAIDKKTGSSRVGAATCPKKQTIGVWDKDPATGQRVKVSTREEPDSFALAKAISKAERNAIRKLLPYSQMKAWIEKWVTEHGTPVELKSISAAKVVRDEQMDWLETLPATVQEGLKNLDWRRLKVVLMLGPFVRGDGSFDEKGALVCLNSELDKLTAERG